MAKFDGVSGVGKTNGTEYITLDNDNASKVTSGEKAIVSGGTNTPNGTKVEITTTEKDKTAAQELSNQLGRNLETLNKMIKEKDFSVDNWKEFQKIKQSVSDACTQLSELPKTPEQEKIVKSVRNAVAKYNNIVMQDSLAEEIFYLDNDFYTTNSVQSFVKNNLNPVRDQVLDQLEMENLTDNEKVVYDFLDKALAANVEPSKIPGFEKLSMNQRAAIDDAYASSFRDILVDRGDDKKYPKRINQSKKASLKEKIFWVKNAFNDFAINSFENNDIHSMVNMAVSEYLYDGKQNNTMVMVRDKDKEWTPTLSDVRQKIYDDPQAELTPREQKVLNNYHHAAHNDPDGGKQGTYEGYLQSQADVIYGGGDFLRKAISQDKKQQKTQKTITRQRD